MATLKSVGKCIFCNEEFAKAGMSKHLNTHFTKLLKTENAGISYHIKIEEDPRFETYYFLNLWVNGDTSMQDIDAFLRRIWLECCGHMSSFSFPKKKHGFFDAADEDDDEIMDVKAKDILEKGMKLRYEYDFGSTTTLQLTVMKEMPIEASEGILLLSRNEPLELMCEICKVAPAEMICTACYDDNMFCKKCAKKHSKTCDEFEEYAGVPVVNSPRMGVCGYDGGTIDKKRDGPFVRKD
jgi:hypothetical protein